MLMCVSMLMVKLALASMLALACGPDVDVCGAVDVENGFNVDVDIAVDVEFGNGVALGVAGNVDVGSDVGIDVYIGAGVDDYLCV